MTKVIRLPIVTGKKHEPDAVLEESKGTLAEVVVFGYDENGEEYFSCSMASGPEVLWLLERIKKRLLSVGESSE